MATNGLLTFPHNGWIHWGVEAANSAAGVTAPQLPVFPTNWYLLPSCPCSIAWSLPPHSPFPRLLLPCPQLPWGWVKLQSHSCSALAVMNGCTGSSWLLLLWHSPRGGCNCPIAFPLDPPLFLTDYYIKLLCINASTKTLGLLLTYTNKRHAAGNAISIIYCLLCNKAIHLKSKIQD